MRCADGSCQVASSLCPQVPFRSKPTQIIIFPEQTLADWQTYVFNLPFEGTSEIGLKISIPRSSIKLDGTCEFYISIGHSADEIFKAIIGKTWAEMITNVLSSLFDITLQPSCATLNGPLNLEIFVPCWLKDTLKAQYGTDTFLSDRFCLAFVSSQFAIGEKLKCDADSKLTWKESDSGCYIQTSVNHLTGFVLVSDEIAEPTNPEGSSSTNFPVWLIVILVVASCCLLLMCITLIVLYVLHRKKADYEFRRDTLRAERALTNPTADEKDTFLSNCSLDEVIGQGAFGTVYRYEKKEKKKKKKERKRERKKRKELIVCLFVLKS